MMDYTVTHFGNILLHGVDCALAECRKSKNSCLKWKTPYNWFCSLMTFKSHRGT